MILMHMGITLTALHSQNATSLPTDVFPPVDYGNNATSTWASLMEEALDGAATSCLLQANLHCFVHAGSQTPLTQTMVMMTCSPCTMDPARWSQPHKNMMSYAHCLHGFPETSLGKPLMS
jgi:hypothetical protein